MAQLVLQSVLTMPRKCLGSKNVFEAGSVVGINHYSHLIPGLLAPTQ
jgi:hypothetical protein